MSCKKGKTNPALYLSRHAIPLETLTAYQLAEIAELNKLLFSLHITPITNTIGT